MRKLFTVIRLCLYSSPGTILLYISLSLNASAASTFVLDDFDEPTPLLTHVVSGPPSSGSASFTFNQSGLSVVGGARDTTINIYGNPIGSIAAVAVGDGSISTTQGTGVTAETIVSYGGFTRVGGHPMIGGPLINLDLSGFSNFELEFAGTEYPLNVNVTYYTSAPLDINRPVPVYYSSGGINVKPVTSGAPIVVSLPVANNPLFNWKKVDGIVVLVNRAGPLPASSYTLDQIRFVP